MRSLSQQKQEVKKVKVLQSNEEPVPTEIIAQSIADIAAGMKKIEGGRLNRRALLLLISSASGVGKTEVEKVLNTMECLEFLYLKKKSS